MRLSLTGPHRRFKSIGPLHLGKMAACLYGAMGLLFTPVFLLMSAISAHLPAGQRGMFAQMGVGFVVAAPFLYAAIGFVVGWVSATVYNFVARQINGIETEVE